ncbi:MAG: hypothetical protein KatS3mg089_0269 [Patescibacteria group bacterium]|nr:MAG: hypothetical protein KatS3mg089_0269 [Patescibacteria group bacterium]
MKRRILIIDTSDNTKIKVGLSINNQFYEDVEEGEGSSSQRLLPLIVKILSKHNLSFQDLTGIEVNLGPGSFTGLRVGVAVANALGTLLRIPINGKPVGELVDPHYE